MTASLNKLRTRGALATLTFCISLTSGCSAQPGRLGTIDFPTSGSRAATPHFNRGVLFLHSFEYDAAADEFRQAQKVDPLYAMAYWGEAMTYTHPVWNEQDRDAALKALGRLAPDREARKAKALTARERAYLDAVEILYGDGSKEKRDTLYSAAMERITRAYPKDDEAKAFYALSLLGLNQGVRDVPTYMRAAVIAEDLLRRNPDHPGAAHYVIHSYDDPAHASRGLSAARAYSKIAPGAAHAQHMTTHIFLALGMWDDVVSQNEIASGHDHDAWTANHYTLWLNYAYLQQGRFADARRMVDMIGEHIKSGVRRQTFGLTVMRARYVIDAENWDVPSAWSDDAGKLGPDGKAAWAFLSGFSAAKRGDHDGAAHALTSLAAANAAMAEKDPTDSIAEMELGALAEFAHGAQDAAITLLREAAAKEDALPVDFGPPALLKPTHELLGETLLQIGRAKEAQAEFRRALTAAPKRSRSLLGLMRASVAAGDKVAASRAEADLRAVWQKADAEQLTFLKAGG